jgi:CheY-like chemotaxis protein/signal transduction histidine kinase
MRLSFRAKLIALVAVAALAFLVLAAVGTLYSLRVRDHLERIQALHLPRLELGPKLEGQVEKLSRAFQDASAAKDADMLAQTVDLKQALLDDLAGAGRIVGAAEAAALRGAIEDYHAAATGVTRRLIAGETGEALVDAMEAMQGKHAQVTAILVRGFHVDREGLARDFDTAAQEQINATRIRLLITAICLGVVMLLSYLIGRGVLGSLTRLTEGFGRFGQGRFGEPIPITTRDELGEVSRQANQMAHQLQEAADVRARSDWIKAGFAGLTVELRGELLPKEVASRAVGFIARYLDVPAAALYWSSRAGVLELLGHHALAPGAAGPVPSFRPGEGLVGQAALGEKLMLVEEPPADYLKVRSGLGESAPRAIALLPLLRSDKVMGVLELALFRPWTEEASELMLHVRESLAIALEVARTSAETKALLAETQELNARLATQEEELRTTNEELQTQQEELRQTNEELTQQAEELEVQRRTLQEKNLELDDARRVLEERAKELATVSAYKSQFLTNMSHELRTPLNSMLLLSQLMSENEEKNLTDKQVEFCRTIYSAGKDLLGLINQVLDLAKVESGKQEIKIERVALQGLIERAQRMFQPLARDKGLTFTAELAPGLPEAIQSDHQRVEQIITNLAGNAIKFTERGGVTLRISGMGSQVALAVTDTGPGIAPEHQGRIFAPFEQIEGNTDRRHGGTGLGLTIAKELAMLLGGELRLESTMGKGSTFTCVLPLEVPKRVEKVVAAKVEARPEPVAQRTNGKPAPPLLDDRGGLDAGDPCLLIIEDDRIFGETFAQVIHGQGLKCLLAADGKSGLELARQWKPRGIILDVKLPDMNGFEVMNGLRADPATEKIPVHFVSAVDDSERGLAMGAVGYLTKPATRRDLVRVVEALVPKRTVRTTRILVVEDDVLMGDSVVRQLTSEGLEVRRVAAAAAALEALRDERFGCMILDLSLPDMDGLELLEKIRAQSGPDMPSVVIYTARALSKEEAQRLQSYTDAVVLKEGHSAERLLNEVRLFVRRLKEGLVTRPAPVRRLHPSELHLEGRKVLVVDDDMRTMYALSATLRAKGVEVFSADTGRAALEVLAQHPEVEAVLMDIMMPEMDGYEAMRRIRANELFKKLPIIALTAKAMKGDEEKCLEAGASGYLPKPIDAERLLALLQERLTRTGDA